MNRRSWVALRGAVLALAVVAVLQGCAVGMLKGAASSGGSGSGGSPPRTSASKPAPAPSTLAADNTISTSVRSKLGMNAALKGLNIFVDTHDGVVTLRGQVAKVEQRSAAESSARSVQGVRSVQNLIAVR